MRVSAREWWVEGRVFRHRGSQLCTELPRGILFVGLGRERGGGDHGDGAVDEGVGGFGFVAGGGDGGGFASGGWTFFEERISGCAFGGGGIGESFDVELLGELGELRRGEREVVGDGAGVEGGGGGLALLVFEIVGGLDVHLGGGALFVLGEFEGGVGAGSAEGVVGGGFVGGAGMGMPPIGLFLPPPPANPPPPPPAPPRPLKERGVSVEVLSRVLS